MKYPSTLTLFCLVPGTVLTLPAGTQGQIMSLAESCASITTS